MQVVKNFSNSRIKEHFTIQTKGSKFYVYEQDILVSSEMKNMAAAEAKIALILLERKQLKKSVTASLKRSKSEQSVNSSGQIWPSKNRACKVCSTEFDTPNKRGFFRKIFCSKACCLAYHNNNRKNDKKEKAEVKELNCIICGIIFLPTKSNHVCCTQKCSNTNSIQKKKNLHIGDYSFLTLEANNKVRGDLASTHFVFTIGSNEHKIATEKGEELEIVLLDGTGNKIQSSSYGLHTNLGPFKLHLQIKGKTK